VFHATVEETPKSNDWKPLVYTLGEAAKLVGKSKSTISKALKSGKLSYEEKTSAGYQINGAELFRVYPKPQETVANERLETPSEPPENTILQMKLDALEKENDMLRENLSDVKGDRDDWKNQAKANTRLLENHSEEASNTARGGFFGLFQGKRTSKD
jgi:hypothetical protein